MLGLTGFLDLASDKLSYIDARTRVLAGNVANADTPGYKPRDVGSFSSTLSPFALQIARTDAADLSGTVPTLAATRQPEGEAAPDGNSVSMEHQIRMIADEQQDHQMVTMLYRKYVTLNNIALGVVG